MGRMLNSTTLAPDIVAATMEDAVPGHVTLLDHRCCGRSRGGGSLRNSATGPATRALVPVPRLLMLKWSLRLRWERDMVAAEIATERLILRPLSLRDCALIQAAARRREVADTMISIPHPFSAGDAKRYVRTRLGKMRRGRGVALCIWTRTERAFCGFVELRAIDHEHALAELSFWLAVDAWGLGYMSEAIGPVLRLSFQELGLNRIHAYHMVRNPASRRVLAGHGFRVEGVLRERVRKWGVFEDVVLQALLRTDWRDGDSIER